MSVNTKNSKILWDRRHIKKRHHKN